MAQTPQQQIPAWIRARDERGAAALLQHYGPLMRYIIAPILPDNADQEECLSEAALRVWEKIDQFDPARGSWTAWLTALTRNTALDRARQNARRLPAGEIPPDTPSPEPSPEEQLLRRERQAALRQALARLSAQEEQIFYRKYYYLQPTAQIAAELGLTERAVEGRLYRIRARLREMLGGDHHAGTP